ncbi:hypothetical protein Tco_0377072, partial [Tanacetum coccineum]
MELANSGGVDGGGGGDARSRWWIGVKSKNGTVVDVVVPVESIGAISERFTNTAYGFFLGKHVAYPVVANYGRSSYARALIEVRADVDLKDNIVVAMPKLVGEDECPKNINSDVVKNMKKPSQTHRGVPIGPKVGFRPTKQVFREVSKKNNVSTSSNKKKNAEPTIEVSNSNPFDVLNLFENDVDLGTNGGTSNVSSQKVNSSRSSFRNVESSSTSTTPIIEKIDKKERIIIDGKVTLVDDEGKPLKKVDSSGDYDSEDEVASVD